MSGVGVGIVVGGTILKGIGDKKAGKKLAKQLAPSNELEFRLLQARAQSASKLEAMADKLEAGEPLSNSERTFLDSVVSQADSSIEQIRRDTLTDVLGTAAGTGFLRGGRTQDQARKANINAEMSRSGARLTREKDALARGFRRTVELPAQIRQGILTGAVSKGQTFFPETNNLQIAGQGAQAFGTGILGFNSQQAAAQLQVNALQAGQGFGTTGGVTAGGTSVQAFGGGAAATLKFMQQLESLQR